MTHVSLVKVDDLAGESDVLAYHGRDVGLNVVGEVGGVGVAAVTPRDLVVAGAAPATLPTWREEERERDAVRERERSWRDG